MDKKAFEKRIAPILKKHLRTVPLSVKIPSSGLDNAVFIITTPKGHYVLRFASEDLHTLQAHAYALSIWKQQKIPVPNIIAVGNDYVLETKVPGKDLRHTRLNARQKEKILMELGAMLKKIHGIKTQKYGYLMQKKIGQVNSWEKFMRVYLSKRLKQIRQLQGITPKMFVQVKNYFSQHTLLLDFHDPHMVHKDVSPGNIMIHNAKISGIIDASDVLSGDPMLDVGIVHEMYGEKAFASFEKAYGRIDRQKLQYYTILSAVRGITAAKMQKNDREFRYHTKQLKKYLT